MVSLRPSFCIPKGGYQLLLRDLQRLPYCVLCPSKPALLQTPEPSSALQMNPVPEASTGACDLLLPQALPGSPTPVQSPRQEMVPFFTLF